MSWIVFGVEFGLFARSNSRQPNASSTVPRQLGVMANVCPRRSSTQANQDKESILVPIPPLSAVDNFRCF
jgi:hypothetical protein